MNTDNMSMNSSFDKIFHDHTVPFHVDRPQEIRVKLACATALNAWTSCMAGNKPPDDFGNGLVALQSVTGFCMTVENIQSELDKIGL